MLPNYNSSSSELLEQFAALQFGCFPSPLLNISYCELLQAASRLVPAKVDLIRQKSSLSTSTEGLLDQLGIDFLVEFCGSTFAVDVTVGKSTVIKNKIRKLNDLAPLLEWLGAVPVVLTARTPSMSVSYLEAIVRAPVSKGVIDCRMIS